MRALCVFIILKIMIFLILYLSVILYDMLKTNMNILKCYNSSNYTVCE